VSLDRLSGQITQRRKLGDGGDVVVGSVIGNRLHPAKQRQNPIRLEQGRLGAMPREGSRLAADRVAVALQIARKIKERLMRGSQRSLRY
jgi:hypothetical protein